MDESKDGRTAASRPPVHHLDEPPEQIAAIARAGGSLGVVLHREHRPVPDAQAAIGAVEERNVSLLNAVGEAFRVNSEAVIHRRDLDPAGGEVFYPIVGG